MRSWKGTQKAPAVSVTYCFCNRKEGMKYDKMLRLKGGSQEVVYHKSKETGG